MGKKVIIHAGFHKTGSSSIQSASYNNRDALNKYGILYPSFGSGSKWINHSIPLSLIFMAENGKRNHSVSTLFSDSVTRSRMAVKFKNELLIEIEENNFPNILLSAEDISVFHRSELKSLADFFIFNQYDTFEIIIYVRHPIKVALSDAQEWVRSGIKTFQEILDIGNLQQVKVKLDEIHSVFSKEVVIVRSFDKALENNCDIVVDFFNFLDINAINIGNFQANFSMSLEKTLALSALIKKNYPALFVRNLVNKLPNKGSKIVVGNKIEEALLAKNIVDCYYLDENYNIGFKYYKKEEPVINLNILISHLLHINKVDTSLKPSDLMHCISNEVHNFFPEIYSEVSSISNADLNAEVITYYLEDDFDMGVGFVPLSSLIHFNGRPSIERLHEGWMIVSLWDIKSNLKLLTLHHESGKKTIWYFDENNIFIGNSAKGVLSHKKHEDACSLLLKILFSECVSLGGNKGALFDKLLVLLEDDLNYYLQHISSCSINVSLSKNEFESKLLSFSAREFQEKILSNMGFEIEVGQYVEIRGGIIVNDFILAYPLFHGNSIHSILFSGSHVGVPFGILNLATMQLTTKTVGGGGLDNYLKKFGTHLFAKFHEVRNYFANFNSEEKIVITRANHIGHRLWNELSALHRIKEKKISKVLHYDPQNTGEIWLSSKELLSTSDVSLVLINNCNDLAMEVYSSNGLPIRLGDKFICKKLIDKIVQKILDQESDNIPPLQNDELRIVFGLRFENRTWINQIEGLSQLACHLAKRYKKLTIIVDGHDRISTRKVVSFGENKKSINNDLIVFEQRAVQAISQSLEISAYKEHVNVINAVDIELYVSMAWILSAHCFIAPCGEQGLLNTNG